MPLLKDLLILAGVVVGITGLYIAVQYLSDDPFGFGDRTPKTSPKSLPRSWWYEGWLRWTYQRRLERLVHRTQRQMVRLQKDHDRRRALVMGYTQTRWRINRWIMGRVSR